MPRHGARGNPHNLPGLPGYNPNLPSGAAGGTRRAAGRRTPVRRGRAATPRGRVRRATPRRGGARAVPRRAARRAVPRRAAGRATPRTAATRGAVGGRRAGAGRASGQNGCPSGNYHRDQFGNQICI